MYHSRRENQNLALMNKVPSLPHRHRPTPYFSSESSLSSYTSFDDNDDESSYSSFSILGNSDDEDRERESDSASGYNTSYSSNYSIPDEEWDSADSISDPPSPLLSPNPSNQPFLAENPRTPKPGLGGIMDLIADEEEEFRQAFLNPFSNNVLYFGRHQLKLHDKNPPFSPLPPPGHPIIRQFGTRDLALRGLGKDTRLCEEWPCIFAPRCEPASPPPVAYYELILPPESVAASEIRSHAVISQEGDAVCFLPLTFCRVHKNAGYLRLEDIQDSESYTRVDANLPFAKVTHRYDDCILEFPPTHDKWIVFKGNNGDDQVDPDDDDNDDDNDNDDDEKKGFFPPPIPSKKVDMRGPSGSSSRFNPLDKYMKCCLDYVVKRLAVDQNVYIFSNKVSSFCSKEWRYLPILEEGWQNKVDNAHGNANAQQWANPGRNTNFQSSTNGEGKSILFTG